MLVAINPYVSLVGLELHILAEEAHAKLEREKCGIRGVCGAVCGESRTQKEFLISNPIKEAIGNAETTRNDTSSTKAILRSTVYYQFVRYTS